MSQFFGISILGLGLAGALAAVSFPAAQTGSLAAQDHNAHEPSQAQHSDPGRALLSEEEAKLAADAHLLPEGTRSLLAKGRLEYGEFAWDDADVPQGTIQVWVDLRRQLVSVFRGGHEIGTAVMLYGAPGLETPRGTFPVLRKVADYHSRAYDAPMPWSLFITNDGVALHGSDVRFGRATHGCVGLPEEFARLLFGATGVGDKVTVVISDAGATAKLAERARVNPR